MSSADLVALRGVLEVTPGTTPTDDAGWFPIPMTDESLAGAPQVTESQILLPDRMVKSLSNVGLDVNGGFNSELAKSNLDVFIEAVMQGTWTTDVVKVGTTRRYFTIEKEFTDLTDDFIAYQGMSPATMAVNVAYGEIVTMGFTFEGLNVLPGAASLVGLGSESALVVGDSMDGSAGVTDLKIDGSAVPGAIFPSINFTIDNGLRPQTGMGTAGRQGIANGSHTLTGSLSSYYSDATSPYYASLLNGTYHQIEITVSDGASSYTFDFKKVRFTAGQPSAGGRNTDVMLDLDFTAVDDGTDGTLVITRVIA